MQRIEANITVSVSDLKKSPTGVMDQADGETIAVLNHNKVIAYMVPADAYEAMMEKLDDVFLTEVVLQRANEKPLGVSIDEL